jgi:hypothetical protein
MACLARRLGKVGSAEAWLERSGGPSLSQLIVRQSATGRRSSGTGVLLKTELERRHHRVKLVLGRSFPLRKPLKHDTPGENLAILRLHLSD